MPAEATTIEAPATSSQPQPSGMARFMADVTKAANTPEDKPDATPPAPAPTPKADKQPNKPVDNPSEPKGDKPADAKDKTADKAADKKPATPPTKPAETHKEAPPELRKRVDELSKSEKALKAEVESLRREKDELSKKRTWSDEDQKRFDEISKETADLRRQLAESAYERSDEFKKQFVEPYKARLKSSIETAVRYFPAVNPETGEQRPSTEADFWKVAGAPISDRAAIATQLFGHNAANVIADIRRLEELKESADQAIANHNNGLEARQKQERESQQQQQQQYSKFRELSRKQLAEEFKDFFGEPTDDPELTEAWQKGVEFVDTVPAQAEKMTLEELAAVQEVVRARAAWFARGHLLNKRQAAKIAELEAELAKFRESDPGSEKEKGKVPQANEDKLSGGIEALGKRFDQFNS